jgi:hypothetical protein
MPHISPEVYNNPTKYWFGTAVKKPVISISSYAAQKSGAEIAVLLFWEYRGHTIDFSLYVFDARLRRLHLRRGNRQSVKDVEFQFRDILREIHDAPLTALKRAEAGNMEPAITLAELTGNLMPLRAMAEAGNTEATIALVELTGDLMPLRAMAEAGNTEAAIGLVKITGNLTPLKAQVERGNSNAAYAFYEQLGQDAKTSAHAWWALCNAANGGHPQAQARIGSWHQQNTWTYLDQQTHSQLEEVGVRPDDQLAYMWFALAATGGATARQLPTESWGASVLTMEEIAQAEQMTRDWKPGDCPSAEHRLGVSGS